MSETVLEQAVRARRAGNVSTARDCFLRALELRPDDPMIHNSLANCLKDLQQAEGAERHYRRALQLKPDYSDARLNLGLLLKRGGKLESAREELQHGLTYDEQHAGLWHGLGMVLREQGSLDGAVQALDRALELAPENTRLLHARARVEAERGGQAESHYQAAMQADTGNLDLALGHAIALFESGDETGAIRELHELTRRAPGWVKGHAALAQLRWQLGDAEHFTDSFTEALAVTGKNNADNQALYIGYFGTLMRAGLYERVEEELGAARVVLNNDRLCDRYLAVCASETSQPVKAEDYFNRCLDETDSEIQVAYLRHLIRTGRIQEAAVRGWIQAVKFNVMAAWPYLSVAWRLLGDDRAAWLDGEGRFVRHFDMEAYSSGDSELSALLDRMHRTRRHPYDQSMRGGTQTDGNLFLRGDPELQALRSAIENRVASYIDQLPQSDLSHPFLRYRDARAQFLASYSVRLQSGGFHVYHMHPEAWISCCFYVDVPSTIGSSEEDPAGWLAIGQPPAELGTKLPPLHRVRPVPGRLVVFPSIMWHGTVPFQGGERLSVVSDLVPDRWAAEK